MVYYKDPAYQARARRALVELGEYFTSRWHLRRALDLPSGAPGRWFEGALPKPESLARIEAFLQVADKVDELSVGDRRATGRFFSNHNFPGALFDDPAGEREILKRAGRYFRNGVPPVRPHTEWTKTLTEKHPELAAVTPREARLPYALEESALSGLLADVVS